MKKQENSFAWNETIQKLFEMDKDAIITPDEDFNNIVNNAAHSITSDDVLHNGEIIEDSGEYESYYSDSCGGEFTQLKIVKFQGKLYVYKEKVIEDHYLNQKRECVTFYELKIN